MIKVSNRVIRAMLPLKLRRSKIRLATQDGQTAMNIEHYMLPRVAFSMDLYGAMLMTVYLKLSIVMTIKFAVCK